MKKVLKKKLTFIVPVVAVLVLVGGAIAVQQFTKEARQPDDTAATSIATEDIPQYAACELVTTNTIKATFGASKITQVREGQRIGETAPNGTIAESCRYTFSTETSNNNSFTVSVYDYTSSTEGSDAETVTSDWSEVGGSSPIAFFNAATEAGGSTLTHTYRILPGSKNVTMTLRQPSSAAAYSEEEAFDFIGGIAAKTNLTIIDKKIEADVVDTTPGAVTDTP